MQHSARPALPVGAEEFCFFPFIETLDETCVPLLWTAAALCGQIAMLSCGEILHLTSLLHMI